MNIASKLPLTLSEKQFQTVLVDAAKQQKWLVNHQVPSMTSRGRWVTATSGSTGFPDLVLARDGVVIVAELKRHGAYPTPKQKAWLAALGGIARLWGPADWPAILEELR